MIYRVPYSRPKAFVISSHYCWLPGAFESRRAAWYAFQFSNDELRSLQDKAGTGVIRLADLKAWHAEHPTR